MTLRRSLLSTLATTLLLAVAMGAQQAPSSVTQYNTAKKPGSTQPEGQNAKKAEDDEAAETAKPAEIPPDAPVITINGLCPNKPAVTTGGKTPADCKTVITRAQFEELSTALNPNMTNSLKRQLAEVYPRILLMSHEGEELGLQNDDRFKKALQFETLQILAQETAKKLNDEASQVTEQQMMQYYKENGPTFEQFTLQRLFVPTPDDAPSTQKEKGMTAEQVKALADKLHARAVAGEEFDKLQKEAFDAVGLKSSTPQTKIEKITRGSLPESQNSVFDLKVGGVSQVFPEPGAYYMYKVVSKEMPPFDMVKNDIKRTLQNERLQASMKSIIDSAKTDLNDQYFVEERSPLRQPRLPDGSIKTVPPVKVPPKKQPH
jgi:PPIC-type PPIASE domain